MNNYLSELDLTLSDDVEYSGSIVKSATLHVITLFVPKIGLKLPKYCTPNIKHQINYFYSYRKKLKSPTDYNTNCLLEAELCLLHKLNQIMNQNLYKTLLVITNPRYTVT